MSWISATDPLALVAIQAGQVGTPASEKAAAGSSKLDAPQRAITVGEPVPIVFGRRRTIDGIESGGVLISPGATEARFENDTSNNVTAYYHLVLSEGQIDSIAVKDVFQRSCRVGSHSQTYNRRAGTWTPANAIVAREGYDMPECPYYCGTVGAYPGMSTLSFSVTIPNGFDYWNRQVHAFIRGGMHVDRFVEGTNGASDNFADLVRWSLLNSSRTPSSLIDTTALGIAADFLEANGFTCNCWISESSNYADLVAKWAPYFLLGESNNGGKKGLRPLLPITAEGEIDTGAITPEYTFTEDSVIADSLEITYTSLADRQPFVAQMVWRQQLEDDFGIVRTAEVRYAGTAETGPYESHDLSAFCTRENHAVKVGAYLLAKRVYTTHTLRFKARPEVHNTLLTVGDIFRLKLARDSSYGADSVHDYLYQVQRISKTLTGDVSYEAVHFPVNQDGASLVALDVVAATGSGILLTSNKTGVGCDINSASDNTIPSETWSTAQDLGIEETSLTQGGEYYGANGSGVPARSGTFQFLDATVESTEDPDIYKITVTATSTPPPLNPNDGLELPLPSDQLRIELNNGYSFFIPPVVPPATDSTGTLIFFDDVSAETLPVTRTLSVAGWSGGGFDELNTSDTMNYEITGGVTVITVEARDVGGVATLYTSGLTFDPAPSLALSGGPFNDPVMTFGPENDGYALANDSSLAVGTNDFTMECWGWSPGRDANESGYWWSTYVAFGDAWNFNDGAFEIGHLQHANGNTLDGIAGGGVGPFVGDDYQGNDYVYKAGDYDGAWVHLAFVRQSGDLRLFVNGVEATEVYEGIGGSVGPIDPEYSFDVGSLVLGSYGIKLGQVVLTIGTAKYTSNFTPPTERI